MFGIEEKKTHVLLKNNSMRPFFLLIYSLKNQFQRTRILSSLFYKIYMYYDRIPTYLAKGCTEVEDYKKKKKITEWKLI